MLLLSLDLEELLLPELHVLELVLRGSITYLFLLLLLRLVHKREAGALGVPDLIVVLLIAHASHNALVGEYKSIADGMILISTVAFWSLVINWASFHNETLGRLLHPSPVELVRNGEVLLRNLRREYVTMDELMSHVRAAGLDDVRRVKRAYIEGNGRVSVIPYEAGQTIPQEGHPAATG